MTSEARPLTGRKVLLIATCAFGAIIAANLTLAFSAVGSFPGVEVRNGYIASQSFERERAAQERLGWRTEATYERGVLKVDVLDRTGARAPIRDVAFHLGRPTTEAQDLTPNLREDADGWSATLNLAPGPWRLDVVGGAPDGVRFRQHLTIRSKG